MWPIKKKKHRKALLSGYYDAERLEAKIRELLASFVNNPATLGYIPTDQHITQELVTFTLKKGDEW